MDRFVALADPTRRRILESLCSGERSFGEIAAAFEMSRPAVSQHLKVLKDTGLVTVRAEAQRRLYELNAGGLDEVDAWLGKVRNYWAGSLDRLARELRQENNK
jgi:DNA-binding transcriptional ArsR family regulator